MKVLWSTHIPAPTLRACWSLLALLALSGNSHAQFFSTSATGVEQQYIDLIEQRQDTEGLTDPTLIEPLTALGLQYYAERQYDLAAEAFARARQITRVNEGFDTTQEIPLLTHMMRTEEARRDYAQAWKYEQTLLALAQKHAGTLESLPVFRNAAQQRLTLRQQYLGGNHPPQIDLGCYYGWRPYLWDVMISGTLTDAAPQKSQRCNSGERDTVNAALLLEARNYELLAIEALLQNNRYTSDEMWELLTEMFWTSEVLQRRLPLFDDLPLQAMMQRLVNYEATDAAVEVRRAEILLQLADMRVTRSRLADRYIGYDTVLAQYGQAYDVLRDKAADPTVLNATFAPTLPIVLPSYFPNPLATVTTEEAVGYIDVAFNITERGRGKHITIIATSDGVQPGAQWKLKHLIERMNFRPQLVEGQVAASMPVTVRYYLSDTSR